VEVRVFIEGDKTHAKRGERKQKKRKDHGQGVQGENAWDRDRKKKSGERYEKKGTSGYGEKKKRADRKRGALKKKKKNKLVLPSETG